MNKKGKYEILGLFVFLIGILLGYIAASGVSSVGMAAKTVTNKTTLCSDSDGGYNYYTTGYVIYNDKFYYDTCFGAKLYEKACINDKVYTKRYECPTGCFNGACICPDKDVDGYTATWCGGKDCDDSNPKTNPGTKEFCGDGLDNDCDGLVDQKDTDCPIIIVCKDGQVIGDVDGNGYVTLRDANLTADVSLGKIPAPSNLCCIDVNKDSSVDVLDVMKITNIAMGKEQSPGVCKEECVCFAVYDPVCGVDGKNYSNSCYAKCENIQVACTGTCPCPSTTCTDSDGGKNYYVKGTVKVCTSGETGTCTVASDSCDIYNKNVKELYCDGNAMVSVAYACPSGCKDGACLYQLSNTTTTNTTR